MDNTSFHSPYIPNTDADRRAMLQAIGVTSLDDLLLDIPERFRNPPLNLPPPLSELELRQELGALAEENMYPGKFASFLGAGVYHHYTPSVVQPLMTRGEFLTSYTPYQPEVSQGTLQFTYEFQSMVCQLLDMEVANAGMYDGTTSLAEGALMACRVTQRYKIAVLNTVSPTCRKVIATYAEPQGIQVYDVPPDSPSLQEGTSCLVVQHPNFFGYLEELESLAASTHEAGALLVASIDPIACALFNPPGPYGVDIATGDGQALGIPPSFGGPYVGLFSCKQECLRQMPGRIVGRTTDQDGRTAYVLTLQTREQHIRRERATSNICTSTALIALAATIYVACLGKQGLRQVAELCYHKAHYAASQIQRIPGYELPLEGNFFQEFVAQCPVPPARVNQHLLERGIIGGLDLSSQIPQGMLLCVTEMNTRGEIDRLVEALDEVKG